MKKRMVTVFAVIVLMSLVVSASAAGLKASVNHCTGYRGDVVTFTVSLSESTQVKSGSVSVSYDVAVLELIDGWWHIGGMDGSGFEPSSRRGAFSLTEAISVGGSVFSATFRIKDDAQFAQSKVSLNLTLQDTAGKNIGLTNESGSITVKCRHIYDRQVATDAYQKSPATCTQKAVYYYSCACGEKGSETFQYGEVLPHTYDQRATAEVYRKSSATCTERAVYYYSCICGAKGSQTFAYGALLPHTYDRQVTADEYLVSPATCTEQAAYYRSCACGAAGAETFAVGSPLGHIGGTASCTAKAVCARCNQSYGEKQPHTYDRGVISEKYKKTDAGCENAAMYYRSCVCGAAGGETFAVGSPLGHIGGTASCTAKAVCTRCARSYGETLPHTCDRKVVAEKYKKSDADCVNAAVYYKSCVCGAAGTEVFAVGAALGHTEVVDAAVAATCSATGLTEGVHCAVCGEILVAREAIAALEHRFGAWKPNRSATCTAPGEDGRTCSACGATETKATAPNGHNWADATCTAPKTCTACGETEGEAAAHRFGTWDKQAGAQERTCSACGQTETTACCRICGHTKLFVSVIPLCFLCFLLLVLIVLLVVVVIYWIVIQKRRKA